MKNDMFQRSVGQWWLELYVKTGLRTTGCKVAFGMAFGVDFMIWGLMIACSEQSNRYRFKLRNGMRFDNISGSVTFCSGYLPLNSMADFIIMLHDFSLYFELLQ